MNSIKPSTIRKYDIDLLTFTSVFYSAVLNMSSSGKRKQYYLDKIR